MHEKIVPYDQGTENIVNEREKNECFGQYQFINLTFKVWRILEKVLKEQINKGLEVKELLDMVHYWIQCSRIYNKRRDI